jgi:uncharacterized protein involved in exopolysaccharide biosynthesis
MELKMYLDILARRWRIALIVAGAIVILFALASVVIRPNYQADAMLRVVTPIGGSPDDVQYATTFATRLMNTYAQLATSDEVTRELKAKLGVKSLPTISAAIVPDSEIIELTVEGSDPKLDIEAANGLADILASYHDDDGSGESNQLGVLAQRKTDLEAQLTQYQQQHDDLVKGYSEAVAKLAVLDSARRNKESALQDVQTQYEQAVVAELTFPSGTTRATKAAATTEMQNVQKDLDTLNQQYSDLSQSSNAYLQQITLMRQTIMSTQSSYSDLLVNNDNVALAALRQNNAQNVLVVSRAAEPLESTGLGRGFVLGLGLVFGLMAGIVAAFVLESMGISLRVGKTTL